MFCISVFLWIVVRPFKILPGRRIRLNFKHIHYVLAVLRAGSITAASKKLFVSQPALSQTIKQVEQDLERKRARYDELMELMASEELYADQARFNEALGEYNSLKQELPALEEAWLELSETIEEEMAHGGA